MLPHWISTPLLWQHDIRRIIGILGCWQGSRSSLALSFLEHLNQSRFTAGRRCNTWCENTLGPLLLSPFRLLVILLSLALLGSESYSDSPLAGTPRLEILFSIFKIKDSAGFRALAHNSSCSLWPGLLAAAWRAMILSLPDLAQSNNSSSFVP